jgi:hypothetical protein
VFLVSVRFGNQIRETARVHGQKATFWLIQISVHAFAEGRTLTITGVARILENGNKFAPPTIVQ